MSTIYLSSYLPPVPEKKAKGNLEEKTMLKRQQFLNQFMVVLAKDILLRSSPNLLNFLKEPDEGKFKKFVKNAKSKKPENVGQTINIDGQGFTEYSDSGRIYDSQMNYVNTTMAIKKKIKQKCSQLMEDDRRLSESLKKYADIIKELKEAQRKLPNNEGHVTICGCLQESLTKWSIYEIENVKSINQDIRIPFSYSYKEMVILKDLLKERETLYANYRKLETKQKSDKMREALEKSKELYGYSNYKTQREVERVLKDETALAFNHFLESAKRQSERVSGFNVAWSRLYGELSEMKFNQESSPIKE